MKKTSLYIILFMQVLYVSAQTNYPSGISNCIARWNFTLSSPSVLPDVSNNGNNGTTNNLTSASSFRNTPDKAMQFNGNGSFAQVASNTLLQPQTMTIMALVNLDTFYSGLCQNSQIISKGSSTFASGQYTMDVNDNQYDLNNCYMYDPAHMQMTATFAGSYYQLPSSNFVQPHQWYLFLGCYNGDSLTLYHIPMNTSNYINNIAPTYIANNINTSIGTNTDDIMIGKLDNSLYPYWFKGRMDELALFNKMLSIGEVQRVYDYLWGKILIDQPFNDTLFCSGQSFNVHYTVSDHISSGNIFSVILSDATGSFAAPTTIGSITSQSSGIIPCTIPLSMPSGNGYRLKITASNPDYNSKDNGSNIHIISSVSPTVSIVSSSGNVFTPGVAVTFTAMVNNGGSNPTYQWKKNNTPITGATQSTYTTYTLSSNDAFAVVVHNNDGTCVIPDSSTSNVITMISTAIGDVTENLSDIYLFPNPNNGSFTITANSIKGNKIKICVINVEGRQIMEKEINVRNGKIKEEIQLNNLPSGTYFIRAVTEQGIKIIKFSTI